LIKLILHDDGIYMYIKQTVQLSNICADIYIYIHTVSVHSAYTVWAKK